MTPTQHLNQRRFQQKIVAQRNRPVKFGHYIFWSVIHVRLLISVALFDVISDKTLDTGLQMDFYNVTLVKPYKVCKETKKYMPSDGQILNNYSAIERKILEINRELCVMPIAFEYAMLYRFCKKGQIKTLAMDLRTKFCKNVIGNNNGDKLKKTTKGKL